MGRDGGGVRQPHRFQYLTYCQALESGAPDDSRAGFRYGYAENAGNALWEIGAQWQSWQSYPEEMFTDYEMETWFQQYHRALENEYTRYQNYWWFYALTEQKAPTRRMHIRRSCACTLLTT